VFSTSNFTDIGLFCEKPSAYGRGAGHETEHNCLVSGDAGAAKNGCEQWGLLWYPKCDPSYHNFACCICSPDCPSGYSDTGIGCTKPTYSRGVGTIPSIFSATTITIIIVIVVIIVIIIITVAIYAHRKHSHRYIQIPNSTLSNPGVMRSNTSNLYHNNVTNVA